MTFYSLKLSMMERYTRQVFQEDKQRGESRRWKATRVVERAMPQLKVQMHKR